MGQSVEYMEQNEEDLLHKQRLLPVEQRPFQRLSKRLIGDGSPLLCIRELIAPNECLDTANDSCIDTPLSDKGGFSRQDINKQVWKRETQLELEAFQGAMIRTELLIKSNETEKKRYEREKQRILELCEETRRNIDSLKLRLEQALQDMETGKQYDELAEKILHNRMLRPRKDQHIQLEKLNLEITELKEERRRYEGLWNERRTMFKSIIDQGNGMLKRFEEETVDPDVNMVDADDTPPVNVSGQVKKSDAASLTRLPSARDSESVNSGGGKVP